MQSIFFEVGFIVVLATILGGAVRYLRQPLVLAYIITGVIVKLLGFDQVGSPETLTFFSHLGIAFLLFIVGLELNPSDLKEMGKASLVIALFQIAITFIFSLATAAILGFSTLSCLFIALSLTFSSTIIVIKLLIEKNDITSLYGRIGVAILLIQDMVAVVVLIFLAGLGGEGGSVVTFFLTLVKAVVFFALVYFFSREILHKVFKFLADSTELLFLGGVAWCLFLAGLANFAGFSLEIGAFLAGITLSMTPFRMEIATKIKPLRDFFVTIFFVVLGLDISLTSGLKIMIPVMIFTLLVVIVKPIIIMSVMGYLGHKKRVSFLTGLSLSQVSEFSLILVAMGIQMKAINGEVSSIVTLVAVLSIVISSYLVDSDDKIYKKIKDYLGIFERAHVKAERNTQSGEFSDHVILIGCHRMGFDFIHIFDELNISFVVLDFDPHIIKRLDTLGVNSLFGDIGDSEILEELNLNQAKMVISTVPNFQDNLVVLDTVKRINPQVCVFLTASQVNEAFDMYRAGADYVILPHLLGGHYVSHLLEKHWDKWDDFKKIKEKHLIDLNKRSELE